MEKYKNEEYLKHEIMDQSRHQFIYGYNGEQRQEFLKSMAKDYPIELDSNSPMAIYVNEYGLPKISASSPSLDKSKIDIISSEFIYFSIIGDILLKSKESNDLQVLNDRIKRLIETLNKFSINKDYSPITDLDNLIKILGESKEFYKKCYMEYYGSGKEISSLNDIALPFIQFDTFIINLKRALNNDSYFGIIIDKQGDIAVSSTRAINFLVGGRINKDISMKIATEPDGWDTYKDSNGQFIESIHDYGTVELDDSLNKHLEKLKRNV